MIRRYYEAIDARDLRQAYESWGNGGAASGQTFGAGFAESARVGASDEQRRSHIYSADIRSGSSG